MFTIIWLPSELTIYGTGVFAPAWDAGHQHRKLALPPFRPPFLL